MDYTAQQLTIIRRMGDVSKQIREAAAANRAAQAAEARNLIDAVTALTNAVNYSADIGRLREEHGDAFREVLDTLGDQDA